MSGTRDERNPPDAIYLQWEGEDKNALRVLPDVPPAYGEVTWCRDKIFDTDVRYVLDKRYKRRKR